MRRKCGTVYELLISAYPKGKAEMHVWIPPQGKIS
jgi:hypothetical protein